MKSHRTLDQCIDSFLKSHPHATWAILNGVDIDLIKRMYEAGWYACANEINEGEDSDWLQERLYKEGFLKKE